MNRNDIINDAVESGFETLMNGGTVKESILMTFDDEGFKHDQNDLDEVYRLIDEKHNQLRNDAGVTNPIGSHERRQIERCFEEND